MTEQMTVKYYYHSGFSVASGETLLVFDYWMGRQGKKLPAAQRITPETLSHFSEVFVFISHGHEDHFDPVVYTWEQYAPVTYICRKRWMHRCMGGGWAWGAKSRCRGM